MDKVLYISTAGAAMAMKSQQVHANNLANSSTTGFRRDFASSFAVELEGDGFNSRVMPLVRGLGSSYEAGALKMTGRPLDVAINGEGWFSVQLADGEEAYTRAGDFKINVENQLVTQKGLQVIGINGPVQLPAFESIDIGADGTITVIPEGEELPVEVGQLKRVNPEPGQLIKNSAGLFVSAAGGEQAIDPEVLLRAGYLESSNVSPLNEMISFLSLSRQFEAQMKIMKMTGDLAEAGDRLVREQ
ncbi:MAG: flagellar basal body rod protein FlgF [Endozoicomonas sp. (ex Botrylloides leachii)]|nr:flagellar basal body rod protein FlgF [Endozoicomonas sp. (ex Botrylloides leachii)]